MGLIYFVLFLGALVFFHELGHFLAARAVGVRVLKFSLGFGPRIVGFTFRGTDYMLSLLPLGGYVKFLGDDPDSPPSEAERKQGFLTTDLWRKVLIVVAGPLANFILPVLIFFPMYASDGALPPAILGSMVRDGAAWQAGLRPGDQVIGVDGRSVGHWWELLSEVSDRPGRKVDVTVRRDGRERSFEVMPDAVEMVTMREIGLVKTVGRLGVSLERSKAVLGVAPGSAAERAGLMDLDALIAIDNMPVDVFPEAWPALEEAQYRAVTVTVASTSASSLTPGPSVDLVVGPLLPGEAIGLSDASFRLLSVAPGGPGDRAGLKPGDRVVRMDGREYSEWGFLRDAMLRDPSAIRTLTVERDGALLDVPLSLANPRWEPGAAVPRHDAPGIEVRAASVTPPDIPNDRALAYGWHQATTRTWEVFVVTVAGIWGLVSGQLSVKEMGGPIMIYDIAASAGRQGAMQFFGALAWLSMSLAVLNILPIPVLDGGHLMVFGYEAIRRRPMGMRGRQILGYIGLAILMMLMVLVFANDIQRKWGDLGG